jgi:putative polyhydroxyalkanoate system protein
MSEIVVRRSHGLPLAKARRLAETIAQRLQKDFGGAFAWDGDTLRFARTGASGSVAVTPDGFEIRVITSFLLAPLHGRIEREIVRFCDEELRPAQAVRPVAARRGATRSSRSQGASRSERPK